jgi:uncharacterized protein
MQMSGWVAVAAGGAMFGVMTTVVAFAVVSQPQPRASAVFPGAVRVTLDVAADEAARQRGLMHRAALGSNEGMIFVFEEPDAYHFWMKNTLIPLDIIWLDERGAILFIHHAVPPCGNQDPEDDRCPTWGPPAGTRARYVIEVEAGFARTHDLRSGQRVLLSGVPAPR